MRKRDTLKKAATKTGSDTSWNAYRSMRNQVNSAIKKKSKKKFFSDGIVKSGKNTQQVWKNLRYVVPGKDKKILVLIKLRLITLKVPILK